MDLEEVKAVFTSSDGVSQDDYENDNSDAGSELEDF